MRALISVFNKEGIVEFAKELKKSGFEILASNGTAKALREAGIDLEEISRYTGSPELLDGRVKTMHPKILGGILADRRNKKHMKELQEHGIKPIDLVVCNLYPFEEKPSTENIDIGGLTLVRAAAKNYEHISVLVDPKQYSNFLDELKKSKKIALETRKRLAAEAFEYIAYYDSLIAKKFGRDFPEYFACFKKIQNLRYGENLHQKASFYREAFNTDVCIANAVQLHGKELSYNNILDMDSALKLVKEFDRTACVIVKHNNPCGVAIGQTLCDAYKKAFETDRISAYGGVIAVNKKLDKETADEISKSFYDCIVAPLYDVDALEILTKKKNLRLIETGNFKNDSKSLEFRSVVGGLLVQDRNQKLMEKMRVVSKRKPKKEELNAMRFAFSVCKHLKSNAVVYALEDRTIGIGCGQMNRVDAVVLGAMKARNANLSTKGTVLASDAFFPFRDAVDEAAKAGVIGIIQPGGSIRDKEIIDAANEHNMCMVFTGMRHFTH